jgi:hypothetical protein
MLYIGHCKLYNLIGYRVGPDCYARMRPGRPRMIHDSKLSHGNKCEVISFGIHMISIFAHEVKHYLNCDVLGGTGH